MAVSVTINHSDFDYQESSAKTQKEARGTVTFDTSYVTNGEPVDFTSATIMTGAGGAFTTVNEVLCSNSSATAANAGFTVEYDLTNKKFFLFEASTAGTPLDEVTNAQNVSSVIASFMVSGV